MLLPNMLVTNEPGFYLEGNFGVRIESLLLIKELKKRSRMDSRPFFGFETITLVPIQKKLIDPSLMSPDQIEWLNNYHKQVVNFNREIP